ncbi:MAG: hypothetical protein ACI8RZ_004463 [Myxococcota bacterium]|jgi:hypothetical protein
MTAPHRIQQQTDEDDQVTLTLPADLTPVLELGWLVGAMLLVVALLPAAMLKSAALGVAGVVGVGGLAAVLLRHLRIRYSARITLAPDALLIDTHRTRRALPLNAITAVTRDHIGSTLIPALRGLTPAEHALVRRMIMDHVQRVRP